MTVDGSGAAFDGSGVTVDDPGMTFDGSGMTFDGSGVTVDGSGVTVDGSGNSLKKSWRVNNNKREPRGSLLLFRLHSRQINPCYFTVEIQCIKIGHPGYEIDNRLQLFVKVLALEMVLLRDDGE